MNKILTEFNKIRIRFIEFMIVYFEPIVIIVFALILVGSWTANVVKLYLMANTPITGMFILRCIGIFVPPLGVILGWL